MDVFTERKITDAIDETMFALKQMTYAALRETINKDPFLAKKMEEINALDLEMLIKYSLLQVCAVEIYRYSTRDAQLLSGPTLGREAIAYVYQVACAIESP